MTDVATPLGQRGAAGPPSDLSAGRAAPATAPGQPAPPAASDRETMARLEDALFRVVRAVWVSYNGMAGAQLPVDKTGQVLLGQLAAGGPQRLSDLAPCVHLDLSTISRAVRTMEDAGLVQREADPDDRRASRLRLTESGVATLAVLRARRQAVLERAVRTWSPTDRRTLADLLDRLADTVTTEPIHTRQENS